MILGIYSVMGRDRRRIGLRIECESVVDIYLGKIADRAGVCMILETHGGYCAVILHAISVPIRDMHVSVSHWRIQSGA